MFKHLLWIMPFFMPQIIMIIIITIIIMMIIILLLLLLLLLLWEDQKLSNFAILSLFNYLIVSIA